MKLNFVAVDIETTGFDFVECEIIEIGAVRFTENSKPEYFSIFIKPQKKVPKFIKQLTHITDEQLNSGDSLVEALTKFREFIGDDIVVCHNASFDIGFLNQKLVDNNFPILSNEVLDTLDLSRIYLPFILNHKLGTVADYFKIDLTNAHRAIYDAEATGKVLQEIILFIDRNIPLIVNHRLFEVSNFLKDHFGLTYFLGKIVEHQKKTALLHKKYGKEITFGSPNYIEHNPVNPTDITIDHVFQNAGLLDKHFEKYELRDGQVEMAKAVLHNFQNEEFLLVEAGTGVGKSLAYLIPSILHTNKNNEKVIISTNTKNLQEQLFDKDLPTIKKSVKTPFKATLLKGRRNYICQRKWLETTLDFGKMFSKYEVKSYLNLVVWKEFTKTGDISENSSFNLSRDGRVWKKVVSDRFLCQGRKCAHFQDCYLMNIRKKAEDSNVVIINHHLLLANMLSQNSALGEYKYLIIDEAHNIPHLAPKELGLEISYPEFNNFFAQLYSKKNRYQSGILIGLKTASTKSTFSQKDKLLEKIETTISFLEDEKSIFENLFKKVGETVEQKGNFGKLRIVNSDDFPFIFEELGKIIVIWQKLSRHIMRIKDVFGTIEKQLFIDYDKHKDFLDNISMRIDEYYNTLTSLYNPDLKNFAFWMEALKTNDKKYPNGTLVYCPLNVENILNDSLYKNLKSLVCTSATITIREKFKYFSGRMGFDLLEDVQELIVQSPFDFQKQALVIVAGFLPDPKDRFFSSQSIEIIKNSVETSKAGTMALFTSYRNMNEAYEALSDHFEQKDIPLFTQGKGMSRTAILKEFQKHKNSVLFGTSSFWEGVDIPGESLELLILFKLPFMVPSEPIVEAFLEKLEAEGKNSFMHYMLPNAILKYRQGFGRLIRHKTDRGIVLVLDNRIKTKKYGSYFVETIPAKTVFPQSAIEIEDYLARWFSKF